METINQKFIQEHQIFPANQLTNYYHNDRQFRINFNKIFNYYRLAETISVLAIAFIVSNLVLGTSKQSHINLNINSLIILFTLSVVVFLSIIIVKLLITDIIITKELHLEISHKD